VLHFKDWNGLTARKMLADNAESLTPKFLRL